MSRASVSTPTGERGSLLLSTIRKLSALILTSRTTNQSTGQRLPLDQSLNLSTLRIPKLEEHINQSINHRDAETRIDIIAYQPINGTEKLIERWFIYHEPYEEFNRSLKPANQSTNQSTNNEILTKRLIGLSRAVSACLPLLPTSRIVRACQTYSDQKREQPIILDYNIYQHHDQSINQSSQRTFSGQVSSFMFSPPVHTPKGKFGLTVHYLSNLDDLKIIPLESDQFVSKIETGKSPIIEDYASIHSRSRSHSSSSYGHIPSPHQSTRPKHAHSLPQHSNSPLHQMMHQPINHATHQSMDRSYHMQPYQSSMNETSEMDEHASSPPIEIPRPGHQSTNSQAYAYSHSPHNQSTSLPSRSPINQYPRGMSPSLSSSKHPSSVSPVSPFLGPLRRSSISQSTNRERSQLFSQPPSVESIPAYDLLNHQSMTSSLSHGAQLGHEIERVQKIEPPKSCFIPTNQPINGQKLRVVNVHNVLEDAQKLLAEPPVKQHHQEAV